MGRLITLCIGFILIGMLLLSSCKKKTSEDIPQPTSTETNKIEIYVPTKETVIPQHTPEEVMAYAWKAYDALCDIEPKGENNPLIYENFEKEFFVALKDPKTSSGFFSWFEDTLFNRMGFEHLERLKATLVCVKSVGDQTYYLVELTVLGHYGYELSANDAVEEKSGLTPMGIYMMLATKKDQSLGYYSMISFTKEPHDIKDEIKMFNGIVDSGNEQLYLKAETNGEAGKVSLSPIEQFNLNNNRVVKVFAQGADGSIREANGCYIHQYLILTPFEIIEGATNAWIYTAQGDLIECVGVVDSSKALDLALIKLKHDLPTEVSPFVIGDMNKMQAADLLFLLGDTTGLGNKVKEGALTHFWTYADVEYCQTTIPMNEADAGSALLDEYGQLIGIVSNRVPQKESFIQSASHIDYFSAYLAAKGKDAVVKMPYTLVENGKKAAELIRLLYHKTVYAQSNIPSDLRVDPEKASQLGNNVRESMKSRGEYLSGKYQLAGDQVNEDEGLYVSAEMDPSELVGMKKLKDTLWKLNVGKEQLSDYIQYEDVQLLAVSENIDLDTEPYVLIQSKMSFYNVEQGENAPYKAIDTMELLKYNIAIGRFLWVGTVE